MRTPHPTRILAATIAATITACSVATARPLHHHRQRYAVAILQPIHQTRPHRHRHHRRPSQPNTPAPTTPILGVGGAIPNECADHADAQVARVILYWNEPTSSGLGCAENATASGMRVIVSIQYNANDPMASIVGRFRQALAQYAPLHPWAISVGNEQELGQSGGSPASYAQVWDAVEPLIASADPNSIRVAGEISPWGLAWFQQAAAIGLPGAQAYAAHVYPDSGSPWAANPTPFVQLAHQHHVQAWATEGMCGPHSWTQYGCLPEATIAADGFQVGLDWEAL